MNHHLHNYLASLGCGDPVVTKHEDGRHGVKLYYRTYYHHDIDTAAMMAASEARGTFLSSIQPFQPEFA